jgi:acyl carrier protein
VADSLALEPDEVQLSSLLIPDLGADSLDLIDILFTLEKAFGVKLREGELNFLSRLDVSSQESMREGPLPPEAIEQLKPWLPALDTLEPGAEVTAGKLFELISVETLCVLVERKLAESQPPAQ